MNDVLLFIIIPIAIVVGIPTIGILIARWIWQHQDEISEWMDGKKEGEKE